MCQCHMSRHLRASRRTRAYTQSSTDGTETLHHSRPFLAIPSRQTPSVNTNSRVIPVHSSNYTLIKSDEALTKRNHELALRNQYVEARFYVPAQDALTKSTRWRRMRSNGRQRLRSHRLRPAPRPPSAHRIEQLPQNLLLRLSSPPRSHRSGHRRLHRLGTLQVQSQHVPPSRRKRYLASDVRESSEQ